MSASRSRLFAPLLQLEKREIHTVFLRFPNFELSQKSRLGLLAKLCGVALFLPKAKIRFTILINLNVHGLDVAGIELVLFTGGHVRPGHFLNLSEDIPDVEVHLFLQALTQLLQQGPLLNLVAVSGAEIVQIWKQALKKS